MNAPSNLKELTKQNAKLYREVADRHKSPDVGKAAASLSNQILRGCLTEILHATKRGEKPSVAFIQVTA